MTERWLRRWSRTELGTKVVAVGERVLEGVKEGRRDPVAAAETREAGPIESSRVVGPQLTGPPVLFPRKRGRWGNDRRYGQADGSIGNRQSGGGGHVHLP